MTPAHVPAAAPAHAHRAAPSRPAAAASASGRAVLPALAAGLLSAALAAAASRPWGLGLLALVAYVPAFDAVVRSRRSSSAAVVAGLASLGVASVGYEATVGIFPGAYLVALILAPLPYALVGALVVRFRDSAAVSRLAPGWRPPASALALAVLWCAAELLPARPELLGVWAFPLGAIGYSQAGLATVQLARFSSVTAVSAFVLLVNAGAVTLWRSRPARPATAACLALLAVAVGAAWAGGVGSALSEPPTPAPAPAGWRVRLVQPNLPDSAYVAAAEVDAVEAALVERLAALAVESTSPAQGAPDLTLLPEAGWPGVVTPDSALDLTRALGGAGPVLLGAVSAGWGERGQDDERYANSVMLLQDGRLEHAYDKRRPVPIAEARLRSGAGPRTLDLGGFRVAPLVCYDVVFPADVRAAALAGADLLAVVTDDSFAARSDVPALHLRVAVLRAIETGLPVALVANTGPSAAIAATGEIVASTAALEATALSVTLPAGAGTTPYVRHGDWVGGTAVALSLGIAALSVAGGGDRLGMRPT